MRRSTRLSTRRSMRRTAGSILLLLALGGCGESLEFADWVIPVPEGVPIVEYPFVPAEQRTERIELVEDLVLGMDWNDPNQAFYRARAVDVDPGGNLWLLDAGNYRVQVFSAEGDFIRSLGREGQGPGELERPSQMAIVADTVVVNAARQRLSLFDLDGEHLRDVKITDVTSSLGNFMPRDNGTFIASRTEFDLSEETLSQGGGRIPVTFTISEFSLDAQELLTYIELLHEELIIMSADAKRPAAVARPFPNFGASRAGDLYVTSAEEYQVLALDPDAEPKWALRVAYVPAGLSEAIIERAIESARRRRPETTRSDLIWPDRLPALSHIAVDGHGHVYVYPYFDRGEELEDRPVDVYSPAGELLFSGMIQDRRWQRGHGDFVYAAGSDRVSGETLVWRWLLDEPF